KPTPPGPILVVDDDEGMRILLIDTLRHHGYEAEGVSSGREAIGALRSKPAALMLLDLRLNDMTGEDVLAALIAEKIEVPFIVVTGQGSESVAVEMMKRGAHDYVMKETSI